MKEQLKKDKFMYFLKDKEGFKYNTIATSINEAERNILHKHKVESYNLIFEKAELYTIGESCQNENNRILFNDCYNTILEEDVALNGLQNSLTP